MENTENRNDLPEKYKAVVSCIRVGKENATLLSDIMILADIKERRQAHIIINELINKYGYVIGASKKGDYKGYYIPADDDEMHEVLMTFKNSIDSMQERYKNLLENYKKIGA